MTVHSMCHMYWAGMTASPGCSRRHGQSAFKRSFFNSFQIVKQNNDIFVGSSDKHNWSSSVCISEIATDCDRLCRPNSRGYIAKNYHSFSLRSIHSMARVSNRSFFICHGALCWFAAANSAALVLANACSTDASIWSQSDNMCFPVHTCLRIAAPHRTAIATQTGAMCSVGDETHLLSWSCEHVRVARYLDAGQMWPTRNLSEDTLYLNCTTEIFCRVVFLSLFLDDSTEVAVEQRLLRKVEPTCRTLVLVHFHRKSKG